MLKNLLRFLNDNHWYIVAIILIAVMLSWGIGCESKCRSLLDPNKQINRMELGAEIEYLAKIADSRIADLDKKDAIKQQLLDAANVVSTGGQINPSGLLNIAATIGAISFGLNRNQKLKNALKSDTSSSS